MKVLFLLSGLGMGGAEKVVSLLAAEWEAQGWDIAIAAFDAPGDPVAHDFPGQVEFVRLAIPPAGGGRLRGIVVTLRRLAALRRLFTLHRPDVVISFLTKVNVLSLVAARGTGIPVIISERNNPREQQASSAWAWAWRRLAGSAAAIVLQTEAIRRLYPPAIAERAVVIPNAVAIPAHRETRTRPGQVLAAVGRLVPQKGFDLLIPAFAEIADRHPEWRLVIFGEGPERERLARQIGDLGMNGRIELAGNTAKAGDWLAQADAFVLSSRFEGFPNVLVEAMQAGLPVVSFASHFGPSEIITDGEDGLLTPPLEPAALRDALEKLMADQQLRTCLGNRARVTAARYAPPSIAGRWAAEIHGLFDSQRGL